MVTVKVYETDTGHVETVNQGLTDTQAQDLLNSLNAEDHGTQTVFYVSNDPDEADWT